MKGYQIIEDYTNSLELTSEKIPKVVSLTILSLLIIELRNDENLKHLPIEIDLISVNYFGAYPSIGIHYKENIAEDLEAVVIRKIEKYFNEFSLKLFCESIIKNSDSIIKLLDQYNSPPLSSDLQP
jgi:hypothetical protein